MPDLKNRNLIVIIILAIAIVLAAAYFSNFLNLRNIFQQINPAPSTQPAALYLCPTAEVFCKEGKTITQNGTYLGFGGSVATGSAVLASFDGQLTPSFTTLPPDQKNEKLVTLSIDSKDKSFRAVYYYKGDWSAQREVKRGEVIGRILDKIQAYDTSLIFQIIKGSPAKWETVRLNSADFTAK